MGVLNFLQSLNLADARIMGVLNLAGMQRINPMDGRERPAANDERRFRVYGTAVIWVAPPVVLRRAILK